MHIRTAIATATLAFGALLAAGSANATTATVSLTLDLADLQPGLSGFTAGQQGTPPFSAPFSVNVAEGDTLDLTLDFAGDQVLTINSMSFIWLFSYADGNSDVTASGTLSFLDTTGAPLWVSDVKVSTEGAAHLGQQFGPALFPTLPSSFTFGGMRYVGTVLDYVNPDVTVRTYDNPAFYFNSGSYTVGVVPEPGAAVLMGLGLAAMAWRRRSVKR